jgi:hypothetical protein
MVRIKSIWLLVFVWGGVCCSAQGLTFTRPDRIDTVTVDGYFIAYSEIVKQRPGTYLIDRMRGCHFLMRNVYEESAGKKNYDRIFELDRKQNAVFLPGYGGNFSTLNSHFFRGALGGMKADKAHYPSKADYSFKDKDYLYKCTPMKVRCLRFLMIERELIHFIAFDQYTFDLDKVPVYILQEVIAAE